MNIYDLILGITRSIIAAVSALGMVFILAVVLLLIVLFA